MKSLFPIFLFLLSPLLASAAPGYVILCSEKTAASPEWQKVTAALKEQFPQALTLTFPKGNPRAALPGLAKAHPRYACFVSPHEEVTTEFVCAVHQMTRQLDDDPYTDVIWGILTGFDAANALTIAQTKEPLRIQRVASGTDVALDRCTEGQWYCELNKNRHVTKAVGGEPVMTSDGPDDTTLALAKTLSDYKAQLFVTSGHATERDWQIGFRYRNGSFRSKGGQLFGHPVKGDPFPISAPEPKVYMPIGNCLMGHIDGPDSMALAWMKSAGVRQMLGYTVPTWFGYAGWGCLDYFVEQPGRYSLAEAFFANQQALLHRLETKFPEVARVELTSPNDAMKQSKAGQEAVGLLFDRDALAFYGNPAWDARMEDGPLAFAQNVEITSDTLTLTVTPNAGATSFAPINTNGSQRGGRPVIAFFPERLKNPKITGGMEWNPVLTDDFLLVPNPGSPFDGKKIQITIRFDPS